MPCFRGILIIKKLLEPLKYGGLVIRSFLQNGLIAS